MTLSEVERLRKINAALMERVERSMDQQGNAFTLFQTAIGLEGRVRSRTDELAATLRRLEVSNRALIKAKEAAEAANISKTRFIAAASHDVLQPLNAANLSISALTDLQTSDQGRQLAQQVEQSLATMDELLRTLLDISKLDSGVMQPNISVFSLNDILASLKADFATIATARGLKILVRPATVYVESDRIMLRRILQNIISNAIGYTAKGGVLIGARMRGSMIRIDVVDTGIGISHDQLELVFDEFHRGVTASTAVGHQAGLGLGLSIVKRMVNALGHHISLSSMKGKGTIFHIYLPVAEPPPPERKAIEFSSSHPTSNNLFGIDVLLIENDRAVMGAMVSLLEGWSCTVRMASQMDETLDMLRESAWRPDIILADQHLDEGDLGSQTIEYVRSFLGSPVPAVIITADPSEELSDYAKLADIEIMRKPLRPAELRALMTHLLSRHNRRANTVINPVSL